jgi:hypothetical protein
MYSSRKTFFPLSIFILQSADFDGLPVASRKIGKWKLKKKDQEYFRKKEKIKGRKGMEDDK